MNKSYTNKFQLLFQVQVWKELILINRFIIVGCSATIVHIVFAWILFSFINLSLLWANFFAYLTAFGISFVGNFYWTFHNPGNPYKALKKFFLISLIAFVINSLILKILSHVSYLSSEIVILTAAGVIPIVTFTASRLWIFKN